MVTAPLLVTVTLSALLPVSLPPPIATRPPESPPEPPPPPIDCAKTPRAQSPSVCNIPSFVTVTAPPRPPLLPLPPRATRPPEEAPEPPPPPTDWAKIASAPSFAVLISAPDLLITVTVFALPPELPPPPKATSPPVAPPAPPPPPILWAKIPRASNPVVEITPLLVTLTLPPLPPPPPSPPRLTRPPPPPAEPPPPPIL